MSSIMAGPEEPRRADAPPRPAGRDGRAGGAAPREELQGVITIDFVVPDYYASRPKSCMGGWGRRFLTISPSGKVLPCHAAETITGLPSTMCASAPWPISGGHPRPSALFAAPTGCPSPAAPASAGDRLGRLPLPGLCLDRRCGAHRPGLCLVRGSHRAGVDRHGRSASRRRRIRLSELSCGHTPANGLIGSGLTIDP